MDLDVLYHDESIAVVNKPAGLMVHDSKLARGETDFAADRLREQFGKPIFLVHRLDRATSGCLLLAFDRDSASVLGKVLMSHEIEKPGFEKHYLAICRGWPAETQFSVDHPLDGGPGKPQKKPAVTHFEKLATVELDGDGRHNRAFRMRGIHRMLLHAERLAFPHPHDGRRIVANAPPDAEFARALTLFEADPVPG